MGEQRASNRRDAESARAELVDVMFRRHYAALLRLAVVMVGDRGAAEDAVQDAFVALHRNVSKLRDPGAAEAYVRSAVLNRCRSWVRRQATQRAKRPLLLVQARPSTSTEDTDRGSRRGRVPRVRHAHVAAASAGGPGLPLRPRALGRRDGRASRHQPRVGQDPHPSRATSTSTRDRGEPVSTIEERLSRDIEAVTGEIVVTESDLRDARVAVEDRIEGGRQRDRRRGLVAAAAVAAVVVGVTTWQGLTGDDASPSPAKPGPSPEALSDRDQEFLTGDPVTAEVLTGVWRLDNAHHLFRFSSDGRFSYDSTGRLVADPQLDGTFAVDGDTITLNIEGGTTDCAGQTLTVRAVLALPGPTDGPQSTSLRPLHGVPVGPGANSCGSSLQPPVGAGTCPAGGRLLLAQVRSRQELGPGVGL